MGGNMKRVMFTIGASPRFTRSLSRKAAGQRNSNINTLLAYESDRAARMTSTRSAKKDLSSKSDIPLLIDLISESLHED